MSNHSEVNAENPFTIISPENLDTETARHLFVEVFSDFPQVKRAGHAMIVGARGSGKSMMFRCLLPDVLMLQSGCKFSELEFLAFHFPIKNTQLRITDLGRLDEHHASSLINEHFLVVSALIEILNSLLGSLNEAELRFISNKYRDFYTEFFRTRIQMSGGEVEEEVEAKSVLQFFSMLRGQAQKMHAEFLRYVVQLSFVNNTEVPPYQLPLLTFLDFLAPFLRGLKTLPGFPKSNLYLFIDDADNLSTTQTQVLNGWLATRTQPEISLKVSAQIKKYRSFQSPNGMYVESPHDYQEVNISDRYTTSKTAYHKHIQKIIGKRLKKVGIQKEPKEYFPPNEKQEDAIKKEYKRLQENWKQGKGQGGYRPGDDAHRYARPNYIRDLGGIRKSRSSYSYSGFDQLVHLSSGVIRYFLDSAALMFDETAKQRGEEQILDHIPHSIQNMISRSQAEKTITLQFERLSLDAVKPPGKLVKVQKLQNLILALGKTFQGILVSERKERRVFSIALSNIPTAEITEVLDFGVQTGYFHEARIGNKEGTGRTWLYIS